MVATDDAGATTGYAPAAANDVINLNGTTTGGAAGSVITEDVPAGSMAVGRARQRNILDWVLRRRPGSDSAKAALADSSHKNSK
jgi:hypothetical protein